MGAMFLDRLMNDGLIWVGGGILAIVLPFGCSKKDQEDVYRESTGRVAKFQLQTNDEYLRIAVYLKLSDGSLQNPKVFYKQGHFTAVGHRDVEKPGRAYSIVTRKKQELRLPLSPKIDTYLLLLSKPKVHAQKLEEKLGKRAEWTDWLLFSIPSSALDPKLKIELPAFDEVAKSNDASGELFEKVIDMHSKAVSEGNAKMSKPVKDDDTVPWYGR